MRTHHKFTRNHFVLIILAVILVTTTFISAQEEFEDDKTGFVLMPKSIMLKAASLVKNQSPPAVLSVVTEPKPPVTGQSYIYKANIAPVLGSNSLTASQIKSMKMIYSYNSGKSWQTTPMAQGPDDPLQWQAILKGQTAGSKIMTSVYISNNKDSIFVTASCSPGSWPPSGSVLRGPCYGKTDQKLDNCSKDVLPVGCYYRGAPEKMPVDDPYDDVGEDLDIFDFRIAHDSKYIYYILGVEKKISPGYVSPLNIHQYSVMMFNPDKKNKLADRDELPYDAVLVRYIPQGAISPNFLPACAAIISRAGNQFLDATSVDCRVSGSKVMFRVKKSLFGKSISRLIAYSFTGILRESRLSGFNVGDSTGLTLIKFGGYPFTFSATPPSPPKARVFY